jgi:hypothetical protein
LSTKIAKAMAGGLVRRDWAGAIARPHRPFGSAESRSIFQKYGGFIAYYHKAVTVVARLCRGMPFQVSLPFRFCEQVHILILTLKSMCETL